MEFDVPMQVHTGMGDVDVNLAACRPALLMELFRFPKFRACKVLLVHAGYPYHAEAGYMANVLPRVFCEVSEGIPFAAGAAYRIFSELLEMCPISKLLYGSDSFHVPELFFIGAKLAKNALSDALMGLVDRGFLSVADAKDAARLILSQNAARLYGIE
jgi:predicted TIM-barrel fold metal-dependent hydrolase